MAASFHGATMRARLAVIALAALTTGSCDLNGPGVGDLAITVATSGGDLDLDGYTLAVDSHRVTSEVNGTHYFLSLPVGPHTVVLDGVADNCQLPGGSTIREAVVKADDTVRVHFGLFCVATGVSASIISEGLDLDHDGYLLAVGNAPPAPVPTNGTVAVTRLPVGTHSLTLVGRAANCQPAADNPTSVSLARGDLMPVSLTVTCTATGGVIEITAVTSGLDPDPNGYTVRIGGAGTAIRVPANGTARLVAVPGGTHAVSLDDVASNCGESPEGRNLTVRAGGLTRDTVRTTFEFSCVAATGVIEVTTVTSGVDLDPDGYRVAVDTGVRHSIGLNQTIRLSGVPGGDRDVLLLDVAPNCPVEEPNPRRASVTVGGTTRDTVRVTFAVTCEPVIGTARIITNTTGTQLDPDGYQLGIDCYDYYGGDCYYYLHYETMSLRDTVTVGNVPTGKHTFQLDGVALNCTVAGANPRTVHIAGGTTTDVVFDIECAAPGSLEVTVTTTGVDLDANGYLVSVHGPRKGASQNLPANATYTFAELFAGDYTVSLSGVAMNCEVTGSPTATVTVPSGSTGRVSFNATCVTARQLAYSNGDIQISRTNHAAPTRLAAHSSHDDGPAWSPDGSRIAFRTQRDGHGEIYLVNHDGTGLTRLTTHPGTDYGPSWSPDGARIAFTSDRDGNLEIYAVRLDGSGLVRLTNHVADPDADPAWSPDGTKIAFHRGYGIHVMNADGSGVTQLTVGTESTWDEGPAWSPDGSRIVFARTGFCDYYYYSSHCERDLYVMNADGTGLVRLTSGPEDHADPAWSPDGEWIVFDASPCDYYYGGCSNRELRAVRSDGTGMRDLGLSGFQPAWRP